jgi:hypothetical protein
MTREVRDQILNEIRRIAATNGGQAPGRQVFERETGIRESVWRGVYWARWGDAVAEAGLERNLVQAKIDADFFLEKLALAFRHFGRIPTTIELRMYRKVDTAFPAHSTLDNHFRTKAVMLERLAAWVGERETFADVAAMLADAAPAHQPKGTPKQADGVVYLIRWGAHFKIGRTDNLERRFKEISITLPETAKIEHEIRTDDPPGIEAYWHKRFAAQRANGEWFKLAPADVAAFKRRKFQ